MYFYVPPGSSPAFVRTETAGLGMVLAVTYRAWFRPILSSRWGSGRNKVVWTMLCTALFFGSLFLVLKTSGIGRVAGPAVLLGIAISHLQDSSLLFQKFLSLKIFVLFGVASFSIYLYQQPFFIGLNFLNRPFALALAVLFGGFSYVFVEKTSRRFLMKF